MLLNKYNLSLAKLVSKENSRYTINGIHVTASGTEVTDGHRAVRISLPAQDVNSFPVIEGVQDVPAPDFILPSDIAAKIASNIPSKSTIPVIKNAIVGISPAGSSVLAVTDLENPIVFKPRMLSGQFPRLDSVWPAMLNKRVANVKENEYVAVSLNAQYVIDILRELVAFSAENSGDTKTVRIVFHGEGRPVEFKAVNDVTGQRFEALVMPLIDKEWIKRENHATGSPADDTTTHYATTPAEIGPDDLPK